ncbi:MAG: ABC transporter permease [Verrucomicrobia bacterium]|nr:ABC transporter permease [Verrucomicrobiota bacterium]
MAWRDSRTQRGRLAIFSLAIVAGIAALVAIHSLKASVRTGVATQAKALLGSDLQISSRQPISEPDAAKLAARAKRVSREISFSSMLYFPGADAARLVQVRGIQGDYPFYGQVETTPAGAWERLRSGRGILLEPALLEQFNAKVGDNVKLGAIELPILGIVNKPPPRSSRFSGFAPEAYVALADLARTGLLGTTSLAFYCLHLELSPGADPQETKGAVLAAFPEATWRLETPQDRRDTLGDALDHFEQYLSLIALAAFVLGVIGVAGAVHAHVSRRAPTVAILRCLGCPADLAFSIYLAQAAALGALGALLGAAVGIGLHLGVLARYGQLLPVALRPAPEWPVAAQTTAAGFAVCCGFALLPLLRVRRISPAATLRQSAALDRVTGWWRAWPVYLLLAALLTLLALVNAPDWKRALGMVAGLGVAFGILIAVAQGLVLAARRLVRPTWPYLVRQGISNLHRPHNQTLLFLLSLGLGTFLLLTVLLTNNLLTQRLAVANSPDSPNVYLIDVQPDQVEAVSALVRSLQLPVLESAPMVTMRLQSMRGVPVRQLEQQGAVPKWVLQREFRSTYRDHLNATETLAAGEWLTRVPDPNGPVPVSLEEGIAKDLHAGLGDELVFDVQGVPVRARITSLRKVDWSRFNLNFYMVFPPGVLEGAPGFHVLTTRVAAGMSSGDLQRALVRKFPNVTAIDLTLILATIRGMLEKISRVVSVLAGFTVAAGLPILAGTLLNGRDQRLYESVLLRTLGASAGQVRVILMIEYATLGTLSALAGVVLAAAANAALALFVFDGNPWPDPPLLAVAFAAVIGVALLGGLALSRGVCRHPPLKILRGTAQPG